MNLLPCPNCGSALPDGVSEKRCPACLLRAGMEAETVPSGMEHYAVPDSLLPLRRSPAPAHLSSRRARRMTLAAGAAWALAVLPACRSSGELRPFTTNGCSCFPDGTLSRPDAWHHACVIHDAAFWRGGTYAERLAADKKLRDDVAASGHPVTAKWMYAGVRLGGGPWWPSGSRWGYGWPWGRGYQPLSESEKAQAEALLGESPGYGELKAAERILNESPNTRQP